MWNRSILIIGSREKNDTSAAYWIDGKGFGRKCYQGDPALFPKEIDFALGIKEEVKCVEPLFHTRPISVSMTERLMKSWAHVLHFAVECSKSQPERCLPILPPNT